MTSRRMTKPSQQNSDKEAALPLLHAKGAAPGVKMKMYLRDSSAQKRKKPLWREYLEAFAVALLCAILIRTFIVQPFKIPSESMKDTLLVGDQLLATKFDYGLKLPFTDITLYEGGLPQLGDIIIFKYPKDPDIDFIKRVVGVPGDVIEVRNKQLYRNGVAVREDYVRIDEPNRVLPVRDVFGPVKVPEGKYFVMGDNRDNSMDSRFWGFVDKDTIIAKARRIYWSWEGFSNIRWSRIGQAIR